MGVGAEDAQELLEFFFQKRTRGGTSHGAHHPKFDCHLFEFLAMFVLTVVDGVNQFMHQGVKDIVGIGQCWRDKDLIDAIGCTFLGPALTNVTTANTGAGEATRHLARRYGIAFCCKKWFQEINGVE